MAIIGAVTDDFTGTASAGGLVAKAQARTGLFFDAESLVNFSSSDRLDAIFVSSNSRHLTPEAAYREVQAATSALKKMGVQYFSKKIDTTLRGGIGYEIDAMLDLLEEGTVAVMVTSMPQSKRICVGGYSVINGVILSETPVANDVRYPVRESFVPDIIKKQTRRKVDLITLKEVLKGEEALMEAMKRSREDGNEVIIIDAITMEHVDVIAKACIDLGWNVLAVDPGPLTMKLAYHRGLVKEEVTEVLPDRIEKDENKTVLMVIGSANPSTKAQMDYLFSHYEKCVQVSVSPVDLIEGGEKAKEEIEQVSEKIINLLNGPDKPYVILVETGLHGVVLDLDKEDRERGYEHGTSSGLINNGLARITEIVLEAVGQERIAGLMLSGGDTMESVCRKIGVECIQSFGNIVSQIDIGIIIGKYDGLPVIVKGGFCGYDEVGVDIVDRLFWESSKS